MFSLTVNYPSYVQLSWIYPNPQKQVDTQPSTLRGMVKWVLAGVTAIVRKETASSV